MGGLQRMHRRAAARREYDEMMTKRAQGAREAED